MISFFSSLFHQNNLAVADAIIYFICRDILGNQIM
jgi:hypothetical protein